MISQYSRRGKRRHMSARVSADFWIWGNWLKSNHYTLDTLPMTGNHFRVEKLQIEDTLYMCVFTRSQVIQRVVSNHIKAMFRKADRPEPEFHSMTKFRMLQRDFKPEETL